MGVIVAGVVGGHGGDGGARDSRVLELFEGRLSVVAMVEETDKRCAFLGSGHGTNSVRDECGERLWVAVTVDRAHRDILPGGWRRQG